MRLCITILYILSSVQLLGCSGGGSRANTAAAPPAIEAPSVVAPAEPAFTIATSVRIDVAQLDLQSRPIGDGTTNNTAAFRRLLDNGNRHVLVPAGDYVIDGLRIPPNTILELEPGTILRDSGRRGPGDPLLSIRDDGVHIIAHGAKLISDRNTYPDGEFRHGVSIIGARRVIIEGIESSGHAGDGFYIGGGDLPPEDIVMRGCRADNNKRQGLSITSARRVYVIDSEFMNTSGTPPQAGIDLETNHPTDVLDQITLIRPQTMGNRGGGIRIELSAMDKTSATTSVTILDHTSMDEQTPYELRNARGAPINVSYQAAGS